MRFERTKRSNNNLRVLTIIGGGLLVITILGLYVYTSATKSITEGLTKTLFLTINNSNTTDSLAQITVKVNEHQIFSKAVTHETFETVEVKLIEGKNKLELYANGQLLRQDLLTIDWPEMYYLNISYFDTLGTQQFNYKIEAYFYQ